MLHKKLRGPEIFPNPTPSISRKFTNAKKMEQSGVPTVPRGTSLGDYLSVFKTSATLKKFHYGRYHKEKFMSRLKIIKKRPSVAKKMKTKPNSTIGVE